MTPQSINKVVEGKRFRLLKYFSMASFIVIILFSFPFSMIISRQAKDILIKSYENYAILIGQNLNHQVFQNFLLPTVLRYGQIKLSEKKQNELMDKVVKNTIHSFKIDLVNIYAIGQGVIAYSTNPELIGQTAEKTQGYQKAVEGEQYTGLIDKGHDFFGFELGHIGSDRKIRTYRPFSGLINNENIIFGVFEIIQDMTEEYKPIIRFQYIVLLLVMLIMALIFFSLLLVVHKAEKIIEARSKEQRELEEQLHLTERLASLGEMVAGVSHEIKNPLGIIQSTAELLANLPDAKDAQKQLSGVIKEEAGRLNRIVTEFLDFAKPQTFDLKECFLEEVIKKNIDFLAPEFEKGGISVRNNLEGKTFKLLADRDQLYRAFLNIFINAMQSMGDRGEIGIKIEGDNNSYKIEISDTGKGISKENLKRIFNPFLLRKTRAAD